MFVNIATTGILVTVVIDENDPMNLPFSQADFRVALDSCKAFTF